MKTVFDVLKSRMNELAESAITVAANAIQASDVDEDETGEAEELIWGAVQTKSEVINRPTRWLMTSRTMAGPPTLPPKSRYKAAYRATRRGTDGRFASAICSI